MSRGGAREKNGRFYAHVRYGRAKRLEFRVPSARSLEDAEARAVIIGKVAEQLVAVGRRDLVRGAARELAEASTAARVARVEKTIDAIMKGARVGPSQDITFEEWAKGYVGGELAEAHPDHVKARNHADDKSRLNAYILPHVADVPVVAFELRHAQLVLSKLPPMSEANRRQVAQVMGRLMHLAVLPGQLIKASPLPRGWLPKITKRRHYSCLYPGEEAMLLAHADTSPAFRLFCGILNREGMRLSELLDSEWWQWNLEAGTFLATKTKTDDPRMWALRPDSAAAMKIWRERTDAAKPFAYVAALGDRKRLAKRFRAALQAAGITRAELFATTEHTARLRAHDMRATFVTISLAEGKTETWIRDRTAHKSTSMIDRYRRTARQVAELKMGSLVDLVEGLGWWKGGGKALENDPSGGGVTDGECTGRESNPHAFTAPEPKFALTSPGVATRAETPVESDVAARAETGFHHSSTTPLATPRDAGGGITPGDLDSTTAPALVDVAAALAVQRATWDGLEELAAREEDGDRDIKPENIPGPAKARERALEGEKPATRGGRRGA